MSPSLTQPIARTRTPSTTTMGCGIFAGSSCLSRAGDAGELIYLDGNSLGRPTVGALDAINDLIARDWAAGVGSWGEPSRSGRPSWIELPAVVGDLLGQQLLGAAIGQVLVCDSTTINLYKLAAAALDARPDRRTIVTEAGNFPTDRYVLEGLASARGLHVKYVDVDPFVGASAADLNLGSDIALVCLSHVDYRSAAISDVAGITRAAHDVGALVLWDLCHSVGSVPISLDADGVDLAVGCTYKYLGGGPGSPAFLYVRKKNCRQRCGSRSGVGLGSAISSRWVRRTIRRRRLNGSRRARQISSGSRRVEAGVTLLAAAGIDALRAKGVALTSYLIQLCDAWLAPLGFELASPRDAAVRGSHVSLRHRAAYQLCRALIDDQVVPDYREPDLIRCGLSALTTSFADVHEAMRRLRDLTTSGRYLEFASQRSRVT